jgi:hypothetical protein
MYLPDEFKCPFDEVGAGLIFMKFSYSVDQQLVPQDATPNES